MKTASVLFQAPNSIGLGHINRLANIAGALRFLHPPIGVPIAVEGASHQLLKSRNFPCIDLPKESEILSGRSWAAWTPDERSGLNAAFADNLIDHLKPAGVVFDCFPHAGIVNACIKTGTPMALCLRPMIDFEHYLNDARVSLLIRNARSILIPQNAGDWDIPGEFRERAIYTGPIVSWQPANPEPLSLQLGLPGKRVVVVTGGGGGHTETLPFYQLCLSTLEQIMAEHTDVVAFLLAGPLFKQWRSLRIPMATIISPFEPEPSHIFSTADLVISQAGYNSLYELASLGVPTISIPARRGFDDQSGRAKELAANYPNIHVLDTLTESTLKSHILHKLNATTPRYRTRLNGASKAAEHLSALFKLQSLNSLSDDANCNECYE